MSEAMFEHWIEATRAQGDPARYSKTDLEMFVMRVFDRHDFRAGKSQREKRRSFEELWEISQGNTESIAYGFDAALKASIFSLKYVAACVKNYAVSSNYTMAKPVDPLTIPEVAKIVEAARPDPKPAVRKRSKKPEVPTQKVGWK